MSSSNPQHKLHVMFFPFMAYGHMIPTLDMAKLLSSRGAKSTIITTPLNSRILQKPIDVFKNLNPNLDIDIEIFDFPCVELGLPEGCENVDFFTSNTNVDSNYMAFKFFMSTSFFKDQLEVLLKKTRPDCLIADMFFPWATEAAEKSHVPRLVFHGTGYFSLCAGYCIKMHKPQNKVASSCEPFVIPELPGDIVITQEQIIDGDNESEMGKFMIDVRESELKSSGVVVNSFYELEPDHADFYKRFVAKRAWHIGPLSVINRGFEEKAERGKKASIDEAECLKWLDSKEQDSVIYISFGSVACFKNKQLREIALGLEASGTNFIWVVRENTDDKEEWLQEGVEERLKERGMIIRGWAPQVLILEHQATGGFVTHCGWNSLLEGVAAGLPMVTWPIGAEQFYNEKLVTQVLRTGVSVGATKHVKAMEDDIINTEMGKFMTEVLESGAKSSGVVVNSFYELEPDYADFYKRFVAKRAWHIGPLSVHNRGFEEKAERGKKASIDEAECLKWLDSKKPDSVVYISFGSVANIKNEQLIEIAAGLEASDTSFIWVVRKNGENTGDKEEWLPEGFEKRVKGRGMIIRGWAPQVLILDHQATGVFVTHCGWNSLLEGVAAGLPMVTWPVGAEQFYNEILVTQVLRTGVSVGSNKHAIMGDFISRENVEKAVKEVLAGEEAEEMRSRAKKLAEMAKAAVEEGGSSFNDISNFMEEFSS
ncbi:hypothetical protein DY000_02010004 [Brassica cretica]|uniref:UDP-glycosyltransferases domain-containing protein n=1 Tax=Brassica cretica TaxID=69181 RepID=A0ABQ7C003_BRACR|nr:hypothetical protein DY000_02010004 [Brassica cretica]